MDEGVERGIITRIYLKNFVTYDEVTVRPGRNLNLIIGANGTGKSTIVSAIVLGLGGNPKVIGRAKFVGDYVKAGQNQAIIEIDLQLEGHKHVTIKRVFDVKSHSIWTVNKKTATAKQISELMATFNIQVDNLCQFLPQDKVQEFSNLSAPDLLLETERSVGDPKLIEYHSKLKELRVVQSDLEKELERSTLLYNKDKQTFDSLKDSVGHINEQNQIKKRLKSLKQKKAWILYQNKREELTQAKKGRDDALAKKTKLEKQLEPVKHEIQKLKSSISSLEKAAKQHVSETNAKKGKLIKFLDDVEQKEKSVGDIEAKCEEEVRTAQESDDRINQLMQDKSKMENDLTDLTNEIGQIRDIEENLNAATMAMNNERIALNDRKSQQEFLRQQVDHFNRKIRGEEQNLQEVVNVENKRLELLRRLSADAYKGVLWLRTNKHLFSRPIHEPMLLSINLKHPSYSKYFENIIPMRDLTAFVCEDKSDMNLLIKYLREQQKLKINAVHSDPDMQVDDTPVIPLDNIRQFGFQNYLSSLIDAPQTILNYIITMYRINDIPIGSDQVASHLDRIPEELFRFFSTNNSYSISVSKYTRERSTRQSSVRSRDILAITIDLAKMQKIEHEIQMAKEKIESFAAQLKECEEEICARTKAVEGHKAARNKLQNNKSKIDNLIVRINVIEKSIEKEQTEKKNVEDIRSHYKIKIEEVLKKQIQIYNSYNKMLDEYYKSSIIDEEMKLQVTLKKNELAVKENDSQDLQAELSEATRNYKNLDNELTPLKDEVRHLYEAAKETTGGVSYNEPEFKKIKSAFAKLPASIEELITEIQATQAKIFCLNNDQSEANRILQQYNTVKKNMEVLEGVIKQKDEELTRVTEEINGIVNEWYPMLTALVDKINKNFSNYFSKMKCAGEVALSQSENTMDFDKYGLKIRVKFRDADELQVLTRNHQSGGERAVTTAVYMIALQELTRVPFRCVDEINQGMDAINERRVFELIVNITSKSKGSQYFLLTPKLLPNLKYNESVTVLTVFNGKFMVPCAQFDVNEHCDKIINVIRRRQSEVH